MIQALAKEIAMRKNECDDEVETIYFGGGTPSVLPIADLNFLIDEVYKHYKVVQNPEFTLESNPDDLDNATIRQLANSAINRLSIGIQSFFEDDLKMMNRAHNANQAKECLEEATKHFDNITIDLIYGIPGMTNEKWMQNIETALGYNIPHISAYALTVEPKTALKKLIEKGVIDNPKDETAENHFFILTEKLKEKGFIHYELSNFGKEGYFSKNNTSYWSGKKYIGIGPSAHSYNGTHRSWNIANNAIYIKEILSGNFPNEIEKLTTSDRYNEYVMTGLRTIWGISLEKIREDFGDKYYEYLMKSSEKLIKNQLIELKDQKITVTQKGKFLSDGIASELFVVNSQ
jgi:oxygen-independent coproporphyrinogen-3 oxidase